MKPINNTLFIGKVLIEFDDYPSTNHYAQNLLTKSRPIEGTAIIAQNQAEGKGQYGKTWVSEKGKNLTFSIILYPDFLLANDQFILSKIISNALVEWFKIYGVETKIKWPNDLYFKNYKLGGILIENNISSGAISSSVVGIGVNINQVDFPESVPNPSSIKLVTGRDSDVVQCLSSLLLSIEKWYFLLKRNASGMIDETYLDNLYRFNRETSFTVDGKSQNGVIKGVTSKGKLIIEINGVLREFNNQEIRFDLDSTRDKN